MFIFYLVIFIMVHQNDSQKLILNEGNTNVNTCIQNIILRWNNKGIFRITYIDINYQENDIIKSIHGMNLVTVVAKSATEKVIHQDIAYIVLVENFKTFKNEFVHLTYDENWKPNAQFLIVFKQDEPNKLKEVFNILLHLRVFDVIIISATEDSPMYTYNPFENKNCGKTYEIVKYDNCSVTNMTDLFLHKPEKNIKGCTFNVSMPHWPPFSIIPEKSFMKIKLKGIEQFVIQILSEALGFNVTYKYFDEPEDYPILYENMTATSSLGILQKGDVDIVFGGMILTYNRARGFGYISGYHDFKDELSVMVKKAGPVPTWKMIYIEFDNLVWILIIVVFIMFFVFFSILFQYKDKCNLIFVMLDLLLLHGHRLRLKFKFQCIMFQWVIFAFLINSFYQSNLSGLTTRVSHKYQISNKEDLDYYKIQPCLSPFIIIYTKAIMDNEASKTNKDCDSLENSVKLISEDNTKYTIVLKYKYKHNKYNKFVDKFGNTKLYKFPKPIGKIIYAIYFYKGFPELQKMYIQALRLRETGILDKHEKDIDYEVARQYYAIKRKYFRRFIFPWQILVVGIGLSTITFFCELLIDYVQRKRRQPIIFLH